MEQQFLLLRGDGLKVPAEPFGLAATSCTWASLKGGIGKPKHAWNQLPGGGLSALNRVKQRPVPFVSKLNPHPTEGWTLDKSVRGQMLMECRD